MRDSTGRFVKGPGISWTKERREQLSKKYTGKGNPFYGRTETIEHRMKIGLAGRGRIVSKDTKFKIAQTKIAEKNPMWAGDDVGYDALHNWIHRRLLIPKLCPECGKEAKLDLCNKDGKYRRDLKDWEYLCRRCHMKKDGRLERFVNA